MPAVDIRKKALQHLSRIFLNFPVIGIDSFGV
jgi:hypothetical protein